MTPLDEIEAMIARVAMGDRRAFRALYDRTSVKLFGVALRVSGNEAAAEEVLQEVFLKVWDNAGRYRSNGYSPMTWLITIARNAAVDRLRRARASGDHAPVSEADDLFDPGPDPEALAVARDETRALDACLAELPATRAAMVRGAYLDGLTYADIARVSGVKLNTVRTWLRRSLMQLRECLSR
ncbi:sigma-70 family RNA polymerase sigma factor [Citreimonas salinaria]|uniref:RNA polymerase sigma factor n=1 Tax=Citreimonas salinaria TaxID=321339 RepID=A0A1H3G0P0_9RHOB|nr:sigma-70 family RNA polymerase sigma factor [Citreimonas salinaria]SDX96665.1 RNA polymerase sigma-70 factor, ECF subfamily [Citreimonas salinaria]